MQTNTSGFLIFFHKSGYYNIHTIILSLFRAGTFRSICKVKPCSFLSTRSYERERRQQPTRLKLCISIHPLLRAGTDYSCLCLESCNFYPPALTSGNSGNVFRYRKSVFLSTRSYEREPLSMLSMLRCQFLSTRSYEREPHIFLEKGSMDISIHPLLRAGTFFFSIFTNLIYFYPPALTSGNNNFFS